MSLRAYLYDAEGTDGEITLTSQIVADLTSRQTLWIDLSAYNESEVRQVADALKLPPLSIEHLLQANRRPRLDNYGTFFQINLDAVQETKSGFETAELDFVVGANVVVSVHEKPIAFLESFDRRVVGDSQLGELDASAFLAALLDWHITNYFRVVERMEAEVDRLDENALKAKENANILPQLIGLRRQVASLRRALTPHREVYAALVRPDLTMIAGSDTAAHFSLLNERLQQAIESVENARELLVGSFEIYTTQAAQQTNNTMRLLTVVSVVLLPASVISGVMGMNLKAKVYDLGEKGFWGVVILIAALALTTLFLARRRHWM